MATATIALVSESLAAGGGRQLVGVSRRLGQGTEGPLGAQRPDRTSYGLPCAPRHAGRSASGSARLWPPRWLDCSFRLGDSSFRQLGGVGRLRAGPALLAEAGRRLSRRPVALGEPWCLLQTCAITPRIGDAEGAGPLAFALRLGAQTRLSHSVTSQEGEEHPSPPPDPHTPSRQSFCPWLSGERDSRWLPRSLVWWASFDFANPLTCAGTLQRLELGVALLSISPGQP